MTFQRYYWVLAAWHVKNVGKGQFSDDYVLQAVTKDSLVCAYTFGVVQFVLLFVAYRFWNSPFNSNSWLTLIMYGVFLGLLLLTVIFDDVKGKVIDARVGNEFSFLNACMVWLILAANAYFSISGLVDVVTNRV
jgi:hypothetical protein